MASSSVPVFPINNISYVVDRSIVNPLDVLNHLQAYESRVKMIKLNNQDHGGEEYIFGLEEDHKDRNGLGDAKSFRYSVGPLELSVTYNPTSKALLLQVFFTIPIIGPVLVGSASGSVTDGVVMKIGYKGILGGDLKIKYEDPHLVLSWDFDALGKPWRGSINIY